MLCTGWGAGCGSASGCGIMPSPTASSRSSSASRSASSVPESMTAGLAKTSVMSWTSRICSSSSDMTFSTSCTPRVMPALRMADVEALMVSMISLSSSLVLIASSWVSTRSRPWRRRSSRFWTRRRSWTLLRAESRSPARFLATASSVSRLTHSSSSRSRPSMLRRHCSSPSCAVMTSSSGCSVTTRLQNQDKQTKKKINISERRRAWVKHAPDKTKLCEHHPGARLV